MSDLVKLWAYFYFLTLFGVIAFQNGMLPFGFYSKKCDFFFFSRITAKIYFTCMQCHSVILQFIGLFVSLQCKDTKKCKICSKNLNVL